jgi:hypothetical protein
MSRRTRSLLANVEPAMADALRAIQAARLHLETLVGRFDALPDFNPYENSTAGRLAEYADMAPDVVGGLWALRILESVFEGALPGGSREFLARFEEVEAPSLVLAGC